MARSWWQLYNSKHPAAFDQRAVCCHGSSARALGHPSAGTDPLWGQPLGAQTTLVLASEPGQSFCQWVIHCILTLPGWHAKQLSCILEVQPLDRLKSQKSCQVEAEFPNPSEPILVFLWGRQETILQPSVDHREALLPRPGHHPS